MPVAMKRWCVGFALLGIVACSPLLRGAESETEQSTPVDARRVAELIQQLGADDYFAREKAQTELVEIGAEAFDALSQAAERIRDVEISERIAYLLRTIRVRWVEPTDAADVRNLMQNYEGMGEQDRQKTIEALAALPGTAPLAALCRIIRFEPSQALSKRAALAVLNQKPSADEKWADRAAALESGIATGPRPATEWIRAYLKEHDDPQAGAAAFADLIDGEERLLRQFPQRTSPDIVMGLLRRQAEAYKRLDRPQEMVAALIRMVAYVPDDPTVLNEVLQTLTERKDWNALEQLVARFEERILQESTTSYFAARAYQVQGNDAAAQKYVDHALQLYPGDQRRHIVQGIDLRGRGWIDWAEKEYRAAADMGAQTQTFTLIALYQLGESLHDRARDDEAAKVLDEATKGLEQAASQNVDVSDAGRTLDTNRARAHFFHALHFKEQKDSKQMLQHLLEGLGDDQHDAEILIELFHVPDLDVTIRDRVRKLIREAADIERRRITENPDDDTPYNQLAWLVSNTEGDFNEALQASIKSLELKPDSPGHLDTLGRCYYAVGDYENAVKNQKRAIELDPHAQQMKRQLKIFEAALAQKRQGEK